MENNIPLMAKKLWSMVRVMLYMVRKGICKRKLLLDLNLMMKRGKIAGKALGNLMFHHHSHHPNNNHPISLDHHQKEYEFSCSNTPFHAHFTRPFHLTKRSKKNKYNGAGNKHYIEDVDDLEGVSRVLEMMLNGNYNDNSNNNVGVMPSSSPSTPFLPGLMSYGQSPMVRQLRITDSPYPLQNMEEDSHIDEEAEAFIKRFYRQLKRQKSTSTTGAPGTPN